MRTFKIVDGAIYIDPTIGQPVYVEGMEKGSQDTARHLLCGFVPEFQEGNELINIVEGSSNTVITDVLARTMLYEAINRLIIKQANTFDGERILDVRQLLTRNIGLSALVFYLEVGFLSGSTAQVINFVNLKPTSLNHLLNADAVLGV